MAAQYPEQLLELSAAVDYVRKHATELNVNEKEVFVIGSSAGGHLAANLSVSYELASKLAGEPLDCKPTQWGLNKGEFGWDGAAGSYVMMDPDKKVSIFIGLHLRNWPVSFMGKHLPIVEKIYTELKEIIN